MFEILKRRRKAPDLSVSLGVVRALCDMQRPLLRQEDLARIDQTHAELQKDLEDTKQQAKCLAENLSSELEQAKMRLKVVFDSLTDPLISVDHKGIIVDANLTAERVFGHTLPFMIGKPVSILLDSSDWLGDVFQKEAADYASYLENFNPTALFQYQEIYREYLEIAPSTCLNATLSATGKTRFNQRIPFHLYFNIFNVECSTPDQLVFLLQFRNVSEVEAAHDLRKKIFDSCPLPVMHKDSALRYVECNSEYSKWYGLEPEDFTGKTRKEVIGKLKEIPGRELQVEYLERGQQVQEENDITLIADGKPSVMVCEHQFYNAGLQDVRDVVFYKHSLFGPAGFEGLICSLLDVTDLKAARKVGPDLIEALPVGAAYCDASSSILVSNELYKEMAGPEMPKAIGWDKPNMSRIERNGQVYTMCKKTVGASSHLLIVYFREDPEVNSKDQRGGE